MQVNKPETRKSNQNGECRICHRNWKEADDVFNDQDTKALCVNEECCNKQIEYRLKKREKESQQSSTDASSSAISEKEEIETSQHDEGFKKQVQESLCRYEVFRKEINEFVKDKKIGNEKEAAIFVMEDLGMSQIKKKS